MGLNFVIFPEKRGELTTEGGLDVIKHFDHLTPFIQQLKDEGISVSLFIDADLEQIQASHTIGADKVELHTGSYVEASDDEKKVELQKLRDGARLCERLGLEVHAGHGITYDTVVEIAKIPQFTEFNIGHFLMGEALFVGLEQSIERMMTLMNAARDIK